MEHHPKCSVADLGLEACRAFSTEETQTQGPSVAELEKLIREARDREAKLIEQSAVAKEQISQLQFRLVNIQHDKSSVSYYTGFPSYCMLKSFYNYLGPAVNHLIYSQKAAESDEVSKQCRPRTLPLLDELFLTLARLRAGLFEQDLANRVNISQSTVSEILITWINFIYFKLKEIPLWPPRDLVQMNMPKIL